MADLVKSIVEIGAPFNMLVLMVLIGSTCGVVGTIVVQVRIFASHRADAQLKRELVERGLSVDEIERIIRAKSPLMNDTSGKC
ncbi:MAG TPA: hypothetical protein VHU84_14355 [Lacipirellulaceae bacterium]|jgi:hypothetical protein|nr:hypothetical protein [Lacipirellulaceae bacterium]